MSIDNICIEINRPEAPAADGSAVVFLNLLRHAGLLQQDSEREYFELESQSDFPLRKIMWI